MMKVSSSLKSAVLPAAVGVLILGSASVANATTVQTTFQVTATVVATCTVSAGNLTFGNYTSVVNNATSTITVTCSNGWGYNVGLNPGATTGATVTTRQMLNGTSTLNYALFQDSGRTKNWGQTVGTDTVTGSGNGAAQTLTVYGQIAAGQYPTQGSYTDTITATVTY